MNAIFKCGSCGKDFVAESEYRIEETRRNCENHEMECCKTSIQNIKEKHNISLAECCRCCIHAKAIYDKMNVKCEKLQNFRLIGGSEIGILPKVYEHCPNFELTKHIIGVGTDD